MADDIAQRPIGEGMFHGMPVKPYFIDDTKTATRFFPRPVTLTLPDHTQRKFVTGLQEVPEQLLDNEWLIKNGMKEYDAGKPLPPLMLTSPQGSQGHGRAIMDGGVYDATLIPNPRVTDELIASATEFARIAQANVDVAQKNLEHAVDVANQAKARLDSAVSERAERDRLDPAVEDDENDKLNPSQRKALMKSKQENENRLGLDTLSEEDRAKFESLSAKEKSKYLSASAEDRSSMLAAK